MDEDPPPQDTSEKTPVSQGKPQAQQLHLETGLVSLPNPSDRNQVPVTNSQIDLFDDCDHEPSLKRKKMSDSPPDTPPDSPPPPQSSETNSPPPQSSETNTSDHEMSDDLDSDSDSEHEDESYKETTKSSRNSTNSRQTQQKRRKGQRDLARMPRRAEFPVVVRDLSGGSATLQGLGPSKREKALSNHIGSFQWIMGFRREGQFMVACRDKNQQTKLANTTSLGLGPGIKMYVECSIPSPHTEGVIKGIPLEDEISKEEIKVLINGKETSGLVTHVQRLKRRDGEYSKALRIKFAKETLPEEVIVFRSLYRVSAYVANPIRCTRCQIFGHHWKTCKETEQTCPRCGSSGHDAKHCKGLKYCINCKEEGHSAAYIGCPYHKQLKKANQIRATTWMPLHEAFKRAGESCSNQKFESDEAYLGAELSLHTNTDTPNQRQGLNKKWPSSQSNANTKIEQNIKNKVKHTPTTKNEDPPQNKEDNFPTLNTPKSTVQEKETSKTIQNKNDKSKENKKQTENENKSDTTTQSSKSESDNAMTEILKRLDKIVERQEKQEQETANLKLCQENQKKETDSLRESFEQEKAKHLELEKEYAKENIKALQQRQSDSKKTTALKEIFSFFLQNINSGNSGSAAAGQLDSILSKYIIDDGHHAFIGNQLKAAGEFICKKDSLTEANISDLTNFLNNKQ